MDRPLTTLSSSASLLGLLTLELRNHSLESLPNLALFELRQVIVVGGDILEIISSNVYGTKELFNLQSATPASLT